jgi:hypothetical protein
MARRRRKPAGCTHPTCKSGECGKCTWNPCSGYPPFHFFADNSKGVVRRPSWLAAVIGVVVGYAVFAVWCKGIGCVLFVLVVTVILIAVFRAIVRVFGRRNSRHPT